ncbi:MAG: isocitrate lyase/PEP mutase family protein [Alphaproteobacteria bacterium]|nr:isocitrate lyase/PEP mutase family protein [Alphaproteobacteria bacterium]
MLAHDKRLKFRAILAGQRCVTAGSVWDPISARIADRLGVDIGLMGGSLGSYAVLGAPDLIVLTLTEFADQARRACRASKVSLLVDADHGYGNALNVIRTVEELEAAGVAALTIEDTLLPRAFGAGEKPQLIPIAEGVGKMKAALAARGDPALVVVGRTSASSITDVDDAIARLTAYKAAGVDALMVPGVKSRAELEKIAGAVDLPLIVGGAGPDLADLAYLARHRARVWSAGHQAFAASVKSIHDTMKAAQEGAQLPQVADKDLMDWVTRAGEFSANAKNYLG